MNETDRSRFYLICQQTDQKAKIPTNNNRANQGSNQTNEKTPQQDPTNIIPDAKESKNNSHAQT